MDTPTRIPEAQEFADSDDVRRHRGWFLALGSLMIVLGIAAIAFPFTASLAVTLTVGMVLIIAGVGQLVHAISMPRWRGFFITLLGALLALAVGALVLFYPLSGILSLTLLVATFLLVGGVLKMILAFRLRPDLNWNWLLFAGGLAVMLGLVILSQWPFSAAWILGVLVGVDLVSSGWWMLAIAARDSGRADGQQAALMEANARRRETR